ncbi:MAG: MarR family winged helix-turn-helix transcriptional regulator [Spirochaetota bacterium]
MANVSEAGNTLVDPIYIYITKRLRKIAHAINKHSKYLQESFKLTLPQIICLREIHEHGPITFGRLTRILALNNSTTTGIVDRLERDRLVRRVRSDRDRRQVSVEITEPGITILQDAPPPLNSEFIERFENLPEEEQESIVKAIDRLASLIDSSDAGL